MKLDYIMIMKYIINENIKCYVLYVLNVGINF